MHFDASNPDTDSIHCSVCEKPIINRRWFARLACGDIMVALCSPICVEMFHEDTLPYKRRIQSLLEVVPG